MSIYYSSIIGRLTLSREAWDLGYNNDDLRLQVSAPPTVVRPYVPTLNFWPSFAAMMMRSTSAFAIRFFTGPSSWVFEIL